MLGTSILHKVHISLFAAAIASTVAIGANAQRIDEAAIKKAIDSLSMYYKDVPSSISCAAPFSQAERIICADPLLRLMERLDTMAAIYAVENGTHRELAHNKRNVMEWSLIKTIRKLKTADAIRKAYIDNTNDSLGGESPYYVEKDK
jgi:hypothetical protein